jgi:cyclase
MSRTRRRQEMALHLSRSDYPPMVRECDMTQTLRAIAPMGKLRPIAAGTYAYTQAGAGWGLSNCGLLSGSTGSLLIDTCFTEQRTRHLRQSIHDELHRSPEYIVNTHHHGDHTFGNFLFQDATRIGHAACRRAVVSEGLTLLPYFNTVDWGDIEIAPPQISCESDLTVHLGSRQVEIIALPPAHSPGDLVVWAPDVRVAYVGDIAFNGCTPVITDGSLAGIREALTVVRGLRPSVVVPGHGPVGDVSMLDDISYYFDFVEETASTGHSSGLDPLEAALAVDLGEFAKWGESERLVANIARVYSELDGNPPGSPLARSEISAMMVRFAGGPLQCEA